MPYSGSVCKRHKRRQIQSSCAAAADLYDDVSIDDQCNSPEAVFNSDLPAAEVCSNIDTNDSVDSSESITNFNESDCDPLSDDDSEAQYDDCDLNDANDIIFNDEEQCDNNDDQFGKQLAAWMVECKIPQCHGDKLLALLKSAPNLNTTRLPNTCRALLKTVRKTDLKVMGQGHYYHCGIARGVVSMLQRCNINRIISNTVKLLINVDGLPISKSSGSQFWPILGLIAGIPNSKPFLIGIFHGPSKPDDPNVFLTDFTADMLALYETGISFNGEILKVFIHGFVCDAPARAFICCTKTHSGYFSCSKCTEEGDFEGRVVFFNENAQMRDNLYSEIKHRKNITQDGLY